MNPPRQRIGAATSRLAIKPVSLPFNMKFLRRAAAALTGGSGMKNPVQMVRNAVGVSPSIAAPFQSTPAAII